MRCTGRAASTLPVARLDLAALGGLSFRAPDVARFPALRLAREVMAMRGLAGAVFNAAKEVALDHFIAGGLGFMQMAAVVEAGSDRDFGEMAALAMPRSPLRMCCEWTIWHGYSAAEAVAAMKGS